MAHPRVGTARPPALGLNSLRLTTPSCPRGMSSHQTGWTIGASTCRASPEAANPSAAPGPAYRPSRRNCSARFACSASPLLAGLAGASVQGMLALRGTPGCECPRGSATDWNACVATGGPHRGVRCGAAHPAARGPAHRGPDAESGPWAAARGQRRVAHTVLPAAAALDAVRLSRESMSPLRATQSDRDPASATQSPKPRRSSIRR